MIYTENSFMSVRFLFILLIATAAYSISCVQINYVKAASTKERIVLRIEDGPSWEFVWIPEANIYAQTTEVTIAQMIPYSWAIAQDRGYSPLQRNYSVDWPIIFITVKDAERYAGWINKNMRFTGMPEGFVCRLPTSEEWAIVAGNGNKKYPWGNEWPPIPFSDGILPNLRGEDRIYGDAEIFEYSDLRSEELTDNQFIKGYYDGYPGVCPVQNSGRNESGIYGLSGNVSEWCWDCEGNNFVRCGGSYLTSGAEYLECNYSHKLYMDTFRILGFMPDIQAAYGTGFRLVIGPELR